MIFLPHTNTVILLEPYCGTITEPGLPVASVVRTSTVCGRERMSELCGFVYNKGRQKSRETTREI